MTAAALSGNAWADHLSPPNDADELIAIHGPDVSTLLANAKAAYAAEDEDTAQKLYKIAADLGSAEAHFSLVYWLSAPFDQRIHHLTEAAKQGHEEALDYALELLFFRAQNIKISDPQRALDIYRSAIEANPDRDIWVNIDPIEMCVEPGPFDVDAFLNTLELSEDQSTFPGGYQLWELAEEAAAGGRFGRPDAELVLHLVCRGGFVPAEISAAVRYVHDRWKFDRAPDFNICDFITSGIGMAYCVARDARAADEQRERELQQIAGKLEPNAETKLRTAYNAAVEFIERKASHEALHGGSARNAGILQTRIEQKAEYLDLVEKIASGFKPSVTRKYEKADRELNATYRRLIKQLEQTPIKTSDFIITAEDVRSVQRLWIPYRDHSADLFANLNSAAGKKTWLAWLTVRRTVELQFIIDNSEPY